MLNLDIEKLDRYIEPIETAPEPSLKEILSEKEGEHGGQCIEFIQRHFDSYYTFPDFRGNAIDIMPNTEDPQIGDIVLTSESEYGHGALIIDETEEFWILADSNYKGDEIIHIGREFPKKHFQIRGYFTFSTLDK